MTNRYITSLLFLIAMITNSSQAADLDKLKVGITSSLNKVFQTKPFHFQGKLSKQAEIDLARNEYEATQVVLFPEADITDITVNVSPMIHENKTDTIKPEFIQINPIGYVNLKGGQKTLGRTDFHPDILLPNQSLNLRNGIPQPILVTIYTPPKTKPGRYHSELTGASKNDLNIRIKLNVLVHSILIPKQPRFKSLPLARRHNYSNLWPENKGFKKLSTQQEKEVFKNITDLGFRNHLPPTGFLVNELVSSNRNGKSRLMFRTLHMIEKLESLTQ